MQALDSYRAQARYNAWFNVRLYDACAGLTDEERRRDMGAFFGSIHATLNHLILCDHIWLRRLDPDLREAVPRDAAGAALRPSGLRDILYDDFDLLRAKRVAFDATIERWIRSLDAAALEGDMSYTTTAGTPATHPRWWALTHFFNHQTHHRGQVTTLLFQLGRDPGPTDLLVMLREEQARDAS